MIPLVCLRRQPLVQLPLLSFVGTYYVLLVVITVKRVQMFPQWRRGGAVARTQRMRAGSNAAKHDFLLRRRSHHAHAICLMLVAACSVIISNGVIEQCFPLDESPLQRQGLAHIAVARRGRYVLLVCALFLQRRPKAIMMSVYDIYSNRRPSAPVPIPPHAQSVRTQPLIGRTSSTLTPP